MSEILNPFDLYFGQDGRPINAGSLYVGVAGLDPQTNPVDVFYDREMTIPAQQPLNISGGYVWNCCAPTKIFAAPADYSFKVLDRNGAQVFYCQNVEYLDEASRIGYLAPFTDAQLRTQADKNADNLSPADFGAAGDGVTDDTIALRRFFSAGGSHLGDRSKTYIVAATEAGGNILTMTSGRVITADGAKIKVKDNSLRYHCIIGSNDLFADLSNTLICGVIFDHNSQNNTFTVAANVLTSDHITFSARNGRNIVFSDNTILNAVCTNSLFINNSAAVFDVVITNNRWYNVGGSATAHDHSTIYINGANIVIDNNVGVGASLDATGTACFIEPHGTAMSVRNNHCKDFVGFCNYTGIWTGGDTRNGLISGNNADVLQFGIRLFSLAVTGHTTGFGIDGLDIFSNRIRIHQTQMVANTNAVYIGIGLQSGATLDCRNITITNNTVEYDLESVETSYNAVACSIGIMEASTLKVLENIIIGGNTIINSPCMAIALGFGAGILKDIVLQPNTIINAGQSLIPSLASYKAAVWAGANSYTGSFTIEKQIIIDEFDTTRLNYGVYLIPAVASTTIPTTIECDIKLTGSTRSAFVRPVHNQSDRMLPLITATTNKTPSFSAQTFKSGSSIKDTSTDVEYRVQEQGTVWVSHGFSATTPVAAAVQGSTRVNTAAAAGGYSGWIYLSGAWKGYGLIQA